MRTQRTLKTFSASLGYNLAGLFTGFIATPFLLKGLGEERFGAFRLLTDWLSHLGIFEIGLAGSLMALFVDALGKSDSQMTHKIFNAGIYYFTKIAIASIFGGVVIFAFIPHLISTFHPLIYTELRWGALILVLDYFLYPLAVMRYYLDSKQEGYKVHLLQTFQLIFITALLILFAQKGYGIIGQALAYVLGKGPSHLLLLFLLKKEGFAFTQKAFFEVDPSLKSTVQKLNTANFLFHLSGRMSLMTDNMIIGYFLGSVQVVPFFITLKLVQVLQGFLLGFGNSSWAALGEIYSQNQMSLFNERVLEVSKLIVIAAFSIFIPVYLFNESFVHLWVGFQHFAGKNITLLGAVNALLISLIAFWGWCFTATGKVEKLVSIHLAWAVINVGASMIFTNYYGLVGPLLGTLISYCLTLVWRLPMLMKVDFGISLRALFSSIALPLGLALIYTCGVYEIWGRDLISSWLELILKMAGVGGVFVILSFVFLLKKSEKNLWLGRVIALFYR